MSLMSRKVEIENAPQTGNARTALRAKVCALAGSGARERDESEDRADRNRRDGGSQCAVVVALREQDEEHDGDRGDALGDDVGHVSGSSLRTGISRRAQRR